MEDSAEEPQCIAWSTVKIPAGRRMNQQQWSTAGGTETSEMLLRAAGRAVQPWMAIFLAGGSCEFKSPVLQVRGLNAGPITQLQEVGHPTKKT